MKTFLLIKDDIENTPLLINIWLVKPDCKYFWTYNGGSVATEIEGVGDFNEAAFEMCKLYGWSLVGYVD